MAKRYDVRFILCEDIRVEATGKVSLAGIYPGELIVLLQNASGVALPEGIIAMLPRLCFVFFVRGPAGSVQVNMGIYSPDREKKIVESKPAPGEIEQGKTATIGIAGATFPVPAVGTYTVELKLDQELHSFAFDIKAGPDFVSQAKIATTSEKSRRRSAKPQSRTAVRKGSR